MFHVSVFPGIATVIDKRDLGVGFNIIANILVIVMVVRTMRPAIMATQIMIIIIIIMEVLLVEQNNIEMWRYLNFCFLCFFFSFCLFFFSFFLCWHGGCFG